MSISRTCLVAAGLFVALASSTLTAQTSTTPASAQMGLTLSVTTAGYEFTPVIGSLIPPIGTKPTPPPPQGFNAAIALINHTGKDIVFEIGGLSNHNFLFQVYDSAGVLVWDPFAGMPQPDFIALLPLKAGTAWRASQFVPIVIKGKPLPAGTYTLRVSVKGSPQFSTTSSFVVNPPININ